MPAIRHLHHQSPITADEKTEANDVSPDNCQTHLAEVHQLIELPENCEYFNKFLFYLEK